MAIICSVSPRDDDAIKRAASELGFDNAFDDQPAEQYIPESPDAIFAAADVVALAVWDYQHYLIFTFVDRTRPRPLTLIAYECDASGRVEDWSGRIRLETSDPQNAYFKLRFLIANDAYLPEFCNSQIY